MTVGVGQPEQAVSTYAKQWEEMAMGVDSARWQWGLAVGQWDRQSEAETLLGREQTHQRDHAERIDSQLQQSALSALAPAAGTPAPN
jgi:hypothetical protein